MNVFPAPHSATMRAARAVLRYFASPAELHSREMFAPLTHVPGKAQADFGEALVVIAGVEQKAHYLAMDLPHSDDCFVVAFPAETTEAFLDGHVRAFAYFGAVPTRILYDNTKIAVAQILGGEERQKTRAFSELQSYYLFADKFGRPAKGNDKGKVEGIVGYSRRNFMVPIPRMSSWEELNTRLEAESRKRRLRRLRGHTETIGERFERDHRVMLPLPAAPYEACEKIAARVSSLSLVGDEEKAEVRIAGIEVAVGKVEEYVCVLKDVAQRQSVAEITAESGSVVDDDAVERTWLLLRQSN